ncbi:VOC family protein [Falsiroseomonas sp. HW251]|uniref:VOC family protein n=1 Tax=Falsiroseomonas sp. HW251 TaxID=3390998 RepID=UPI003D323EB2
MSVSAYLHHLQLLSPDPERLAAFYGDAIDMAVSRRGDVFLCTGARRRILVAAGPAKTLGFAGLACRDAGDLAALRARAEAGGIPIEPSPSPLLSDAFCVRDADGNRIVFGLHSGDPSDGARRLNGPIQHLTFATRDLDAFHDFYARRLGFFVSDRVIDTAGTMRTCFTTSNHEHHTIAAFLADRTGIDHHSYEAGDWITIRDWCDRFGARRIPLIWGPGRHGPGNNLFAFIADPDGNWIEISAELEIIHDRPAKDWPHEPHTLNSWGQAIMRS